MAPGKAKTSLIGNLIEFCLDQKLIVGLALAVVVAAGVMFAPFDWDTGWFPRDPVPVDAIPDVSENQQIVFTEWPGHSPQEIQDQITLPLSTTLMGISGVRVVRSTSMYGFSSIYVIFEEGVDLDTSRNRILSRLNSLPRKLPEGVRPKLGPEATPVGQIFWYTLEGRDENGRPVNAWNLEELRSLQDWALRYHLLAAKDAKGRKPIAEVASVGGHVREYQIDVDPDKMRVNGVTLRDVFGAVQRSNVDVGARTIEVNNVEYLLRGIGYLESIADIENSVITVNDDVPIYIRNVATVTTGQALRRGVLDKEGAEAVGAVVVVRYGANPLSAIKAVKAKLSELGEHKEDRHGPYWWLYGKPRTLPDGRVCRVAVVPFYDRTGLIYETLDTLNTALVLEIIVTVIVVLVMVRHLRSSLIISASLPVAILLCFIAMRAFGVDANIVALSGIAIAIGTIVDMGIIMCENILRHLDEAAPGEDRREVICRAAGEVGGAVLTAVATTVVGFLPVFAMRGEGGRMFRPLALTKTFVLVASVVIALTMVPAAAHLLMGRRGVSRKLKTVLLAALIAAGVAIALAFSWWAGLILAAMGAYHLAADLVPPRARRITWWVALAAVIVAVGVLLARKWQPLGVARGALRNLVFVAVLVGGLLLFFYLFRRFYVLVLRWCLAHKLAFLCIPAVLVLAGLAIWLGFDKAFGVVPAGAEKLGLSGQAIRETVLWSGLSKKFPGLGAEFMPPLDEGSFLYMPSTMPHASIGQAHDVLRYLDVAIKSIPEVDTVVGKIGRVKSPLDPAPISMVEAVINYKPEYVTDKRGRRQRFKVDHKTGSYFREGGQLVPDPTGRPFRQWRPNIKSSDDIWDEITRAAAMPGVTGADKLQPIITRIVMLQSGLRTAMGVRVKGRDLESIERSALEIERFLRQVPGVEPRSVNAERIVGRPYLNIKPDRRAIGPYNLKVQDVQDVIDIALGGRTITTTVMGRESYPVRVRYPSELRSDLESIGRILVPAPDGKQIPLVQLTNLSRPEEVYARGPRAIKSEDSYLVGYVAFGKKPGHAEVDVVEACREYLEAKRIAGELRLDPDVAYDFAGTYESQVRWRKRLAQILPLTLVLIFLILYLQFRAVPTTLLVFGGILVAWAGGFLLIWLYGQPWFLDFELFGVGMRDLFQVHTVYMSVAIWVGFLALFGIASDDGVVMATYLNQTFARDEPESIREIREATVAAAGRRIRPCLMTSATTILALLPVLTSTGRGADVMVPMALPVFGGMLVVLISEFVTPVLYCAFKEFKRHTGISDGWLGLLLLVTGMLAVCPILIYCWIRGLGPGQEG